MPDLFAPVKARALCIPGMAAAGRENGADVAALPRMSRDTNSETIAWTQSGISAVPLQRFSGRVGAVEVGLVEYDGSNRLWTWWSPLAEDVWGHAGDADGARRACEMWLRGWLENFRPFFEAARR